MSRPNASTAAESESDAVIVNKASNGITTLTLNRPSRRNAVDRPTARKLTEAFLDFEEDATQKVCVFHGANGMFCAGGDLKEIGKQPSKSLDGDSSNAEGENPQAISAGPVEGRNPGPMGPSRMWIRKPVIVAVTGFAVAGGLELSLLGDMRVVEEDAVFGVYCRRWGVPLIDGGTVRLQAVIGFGHAMDMILTGRAVDAKEALAMGLANRVVPKGKAVEEATKIAELLLSFPQECMNADRASCYYARYEATSFEDAMRNEFDNGIKAFISEGREGAAKFSSGAGRHGKL